MKKRLIFGLVFSVFFGLLMISCRTQTHASYSLPDLVGVWEGSYFAAQGETGMTMTVWEENGNFRAIWYFYNLPDRTNPRFLPVGEDGSVYMHVTSNQSTEKYNLVAYEWITIPNVPNATFTLMSLEGIVHGNTFSGNALVQGRSDSTFTFHVVRQ